MPAVDTEGAPEWLSVDEFSLENRPGHGAFTLPFYAAPFPDFFDLNHGLEVDFRYHMQRI